MKRTRPYRILEESKKANSSCFSIYADSREHYREQIARLQNVCSADLDTSQIRAAVAPFAEAEKLFSKIPTGTSLGIFVNRHFSGFVLLPFKTRNLAVAATSFHIKPLVKWIQHQKPFALLYLEYDKVRLYEGSQTDLQLIRSHAVDLHTETEEVLKKLDASIYTQLQASRYPLIIAGEPILTGYFKELTLYRRLVDKCVDLDQRPVHKDDLLLKALASLESYIHQYEHQMLSAYWSAKLEFKTSTHLTEIAKAAVAGQVRTLFVNEQTNVWGYLNPQSGELKTHPHQLDTADDDVLDDLAEIVLHHGGSVTVLPPDKMPDSQAAAAIMRDFVSLKKLKNRSNDQKQPRSLLNQPSNQLSHNR